ncbi:MAG: PilZ domain-containing protein [Terriglobia bacterium]
MRWAEDERRVFRRAEFTGEVSLQCTGREYILTSRDVSEGGIGTGPVPGLVAPAEGSVEFLEVPVACRCRVVYSAQGEGVGIEFLDLSDESRIALKNLVDEAN